MNIHKLEKKLATAIIALFLLSLLPLLFISVYDHPCADDFSYGLAAHLAWQNTGSVFQTLAAAAGKVIERYNKWQGTFASIFLMAIQPAVFSERAYVITPFLLLFMLCSGTIALLKELLLGYLNSTKAQTAIIAGTLTALSIQLLFSPVDAIYWYNGAIHYVFMYSCMLLSLAALLKYIRTSKKHVFVLACILSFIVGGGNYVTGLTAILLECIVAVFMIVYRKKRFAPVAIITVVSILSLVISGIAPGNSVRQSHFDKLSFIETILQSFKDGFYFITANIDLLYVLLLLFLVPVIVHVTLNTKVTFKLPLFIPVISYCLISAMFAPTEYTMHVFYVGRTANVVLLMIQLLGVLNEIYLIGYVVQNRKKANVNFFLNEKKILSWYAIIVILMGAAFLNTYKTKNYTSVNALLSWKSGEIPAYDLEIKERLTMLEDPEAETVEFSPLVHKPHLLYFDDITENKKDWRNKAMARFYRKKSVALK